jgi:hypothetical protein
MVWFGLWCSTPLSSIFLLYQEYNQMKKDKELEQGKQKLGSNDCHTPTQDSLMDTRTRTEFIHERIGCFFSNLKGITFTI